MRSHFASRMLVVSRLFPLVATAGMLALIAGLTGCGVATTSPVAPASPVSPAAPVTKGAITGNLHGGQQAVSGAQVFLYAIGTTPGGPSQSLLTTPGGYVLSDSQGNWSITGDYTCPANAYVYVLALGGNPGLAPGTNNPKLALASLLGACSSLSSTQFFNVNEITTVVAASALAGIATSETQIGSANLTVVANAATRNTTMVDPFAGAARTFTPDNTGSVPRAKINSLADSLAACINSDGTTTSACQTLMDTSGLSNTSLTPDTFNAAIVIAQIPDNDPGDIFDLAQPSAPFEPTLIDGPVDWSLAPQYSGQSNLGNGTSVSPDSATITAGGQVALTTGGGLSYLWTTTGAFGKLSDPNGPGGTNFCSTSPTASYVSSGGITAPSTDAVMVQVFWVPSCVGNPGGQATAAITTVPVTPSVLPVSPTSSFVGQVVLPSGVQLQQDALVVMNSITQTTPDGGGNFTLPYYNSGSQIAIVASPDGTPILVGWLDGNHSTIDESTTAEVLAFYALGGASMLNASDRASMIAQIPQLPGFSDLVTAIDSELNANYDAFAAPNANVIAALDTLYTQITGQPTKNVRVPFVSPHDVLINPLSPQSGVSLSNEEPPAPYITTSTITPWATFVTNAYRRRAHYFVMRQKDTTGGVDTPLGVQVTDADISATVGVNGGVTGAVVDMFKAYYGSQPTAYAPVTTDPLDLTPDSGVDSTTFQIITVGAGGSGAPRPVQLTAAQQTILTTTAFNGFISDVFIPFVNNVLTGAGDNSSTALSGSSVSPYVAALEENLAAVVNQLPGEQDKLVAGQYDVVLSDLLYNSATLPAVDAALQAALASAVPAASTEAYGLALDKFTAVLKAANAGLQVFDSSIYLAQILGSDNVDVFTVTSSKFKATLTPKATTFTSLNSVALKAVVLNAPSGAQLSYMWTITPQSGQSLVGTITENGGAGRSLPDSGGGMSVCSTSVDWTYSNNASAFNALTMPATDTVTVKGYYGPNCQSGKDITNTPSATITNNANASITITPAPSTIEAGEFVAMMAALSNPKNPSQTPPVSWKWQLNGTGATVYGTLSNSDGTAGTSGATFCSTSASAQYTSTQTDPVTTSQTDQVEAFAYPQANCQGTAMSLVPGMTSVTTRTTPNLILSPTHATLQAGETVSLSLSSSADTTGFSFRWTTPGLFGTLTDTGGTGDTELKSYCTTSNTATFVANTSQTVKAPITDTVTVLAYAGSGCGTDSQFGRSSAAKLTLQTKPTLIGTPTQMLGQIVASDGNIYAVGATYSPFTLFYPLNNFPAQLTGDSIFRITPNGQVSIVADLKYPSNDPLQGGNIMTTPGLSPLVEGPDDALYGIAQSGPTSADFGYFFKVSLVDYSVTTLQVFSGAQGAAGTDIFGPPLLASDGNWYTNSALGIVKLTPYGQASFLYQYPDILTNGGEAPYPLIQASDSNLYTIYWPSAVGAPATLQSTTLGGTSASLYNFGAVTGKGTYTFFANAPNTPIAEGGDGALYMTTSGERPGFNACQSYGSPDGTSQCVPMPAASVFRFQPNGGGSAIYNFTSLPDGTAPHTGLVAGSDGNLYGMASTGGDTDTECYTFDPSVSVQGNGTTTTTIGDEGCGTVFRITPGGVYTPMYTFRNAAEGRLSTGQSNPIPYVQMRAGLAIDQSGNIVGASALSGAGNYTISASEDFKLPLFDGGPIKMSFNQSSIPLGQSVTLTWSVSNAFSLSAQQCYAHNIAANGGGGTWNGLQAGVLDSTGFHGSATIQPKSSGTYIYALTCGGTESGSAILTVP